MMSIEGILCPITLSEDSEEALRYAFLLARAYHTNLSLCHCAPAPTLLTSLATAVPKTGINKELADSLSSYFGPAKSLQSPCEVIVVQSGPDVGEEIVRTASERRVDLIVMCSQRPRVATLLGSTAEQVVRTASCPVLVIHKQAEDNKTNANGHFGFARVLVSHDFSSSSELALSYALSIAQTFGAALHLLHVLPEREEYAPEMPGNDVDATSAYRRTLKRLQASVPAYVHENCSVTYAVRWGKPYREVLGYALEHEVDLVCMGALGRDFGMQALFGSNVDRVLRQASCPVLIAGTIRAAKSVLLDLRTIAGHLGALSSLLGFYFCLNC